MRLRYSSNGFAPGQCCSFAISIERRFLPSVQSHQTLRSFPGGQCILAMHIQTVSAPVNLGCAQLHQFQQRFFETAIGEISFQCMQGPNPFGRKFVVGDSGLVSVHHRANWRRNRYTKRSIIDKICWSTSSQKEKRRAALVRPFRPYQRPAWAPPSTCRISPVTKVADVRKGLGCLRSPVYGFVEIKIRLVASPGGTDTLV